ncbi:MAG: 2-oxo acid dehydrogenase subunit E2 [Pseudanabaenales cyanobacterium]|nr:2-oxo acid dehydrogenase subunit E2 [Pseudanabaenales cyanobacterium]
MIREVFMPALSSTMSEGKIVAWVKSPGDKVEKGETVVIVESDKADMDVESFYEGYLAVIVVESGGVAPVGEAIALLAETEAEIEAAQKQGAASRSATEIPAAAPAATAAEAAATEATQNGADSGRSSGRIIVSPRARKLAKSLKVDLSAVKGTGPHGRIVAQDIEIAAGKTPTLTAPAAVALSPTAAISAIPTPSSVPPAPASAPTAPGQVVAFTTLQQAVVRNMLTSLAAPTYRVGYTMTTDNLDRLYKQIKPKGVTITAMLAKAVAVTLQKHPLLNASYTDQGIHYGANINIAMAVAMEDGGLITPVLKQADQIDIYSLSRTWKDLVNRARAKQLQPDEYNSGTFTLSNLGMFGVDRFDAILPPGQGAILAVGASCPQVVAAPDGMMGIRRQMQVNITCDHRIIYGAHAAAFLKDLAQLIENDPQSLTL